MARIHINRFKTALYQDISSVVTTIALENAGVGFPTLGTGETVNLTISNGAYFEIVTITAQTAGVCTVIRAAESSTARAWLKGTAIACTATAGSVDNKHERNAAIGGMITSNVLQCVGALMEVTCSGASSDLETISNGLPGQFLVLYPATGKTITLKDGVDNLALPADVVLNAPADTATLIYSSTDSVWKLLASSDNA